MPNQNLIRQLKSKSPHEREAAAYNLGKLGAKDAVDELIQRLNDDNLFVIRAAVKALGLIGDKRALPVLETLLSKSTKLVGFINEKDFLHEWATLAINRINIEESSFKVDAILSKSKHDKHDMKELGALGDKKAIPILKRYATPSASKFAYKELPRYTGDDDWTDYEALLAIAKLDGDNHLPFIINFFEYYGTGFRYGLPTNYFVGMAVEALGKVGPEAIPELEEAVRLKRPVGADEVTKALQDIGLAAVPFLIKLVQRNYLRKDAIQLLSKMRDPRAIRVLQKIFHGKEGPFVKHAEVALKSFDVPENNIDVDEIIYLLNERIPKSTATHNHCSKDPKMRNYWPYRTDDKVIEFLPQAIKFRRKGYDFRIHHQHEKARNVGDGTGKSYRRYDQFESIKIVPHKSDQPILSKQDIIALIQQRIPEEHHGLISDSNITLARRLYEAFGDFKTIFQESEQVLRGRVLNASERKLYANSKNVEHVAEKIKIDYPNK